MKQGVLLFLLVLKCTEIYSQNTVMAYPFVDIKAFMTVSIQVNSNATSDFNFVTIDEITDGILKSALFVVKVKANKNWRLQVSSLNSFLTPISPGISTNYPVNVLSFRQVGAISWKELSTAQQELANGSRGSWNRAGNTFNLDTKVTPTLQMESGVYSCEVYFTLTPD